MAKRKKIEKDYVVYEICPLDKEELEPQMNEENYVESYYCPECQKYWHLEDLPIKEIKPQKSLMEYVKK